MDRFEKIKRLIADENISINDEKLYQELLENVDDEQFEQHYVATQKLVDDFKKKYEYSVAFDTEAKSYDLTVKEVGGGDDSSEESEAKPVTEEVGEPQPEQKKAEETEEQKPEQEKKQETLEEKNAEALVSQKTLDQISLVLDKISQGEVRYARVEETLAKMKKQFEEQWENTNKTIRSVSKKLKDMEDEDLNVSKSIKDDGRKRSAPRDENEDIFRSLFDRTPFHKSFTQKQGEDSW